MKIPGCRILFFPMIVLAGLIMTPPAFTEGTQKQGQGIGQPSIVINSESLEIDNTRNLVTFTGNVDAKKDNFRINCQKMILYYMDRSGEKDAGQRGLKIDRIVAEGKVKIIRSEGGTATAEQAVYYQNDEKLVLTGNPVVKQGNDFVEGTRVILFLKEKRSIVEGSEDHKVRAVLFPRDEKR